MAEVNRPWTDAAPALLAKLGRPDGDHEAWQSWQKHLANRRGPKPLVELFSGKTHPLLWSVPGEARTHEIVALLSAAASTNGKWSLPKLLPVIDRWLANDCGTEADATSLLGELVTAHLLPWLAGRMSGEQWWKLLDMLCRRACERCTLSLDENVDGRLAWADQVLAGELPWTLAYSFPELRLCAGLVGTARTVLSDGLNGLTDGEGLLHARHLPWLRPLLASWTRCLGMARSMGRLPWSDDAHVQYEWGVRQALRLTRSDGSQLLGEGSACQWQPDLFRAALSVAGDDEDAAAARLALPRDVKKVGGADELPCEPAVDSEWSQLAVLRTGWERNAPRLAVNYSGPDVIVELEAGCRTLFVGAWQLEVRAGGASLALAGEWQEVCWLSDDDVDYLELSIDLAGGGRIDRQMLLARQDRFLFLCENVADGPQAAIEAVSRIPLADAVELTFEKETREAGIGGKKPLGLVMPLALPEWRVGPHLGELKLNGRSLELHQKGTGGNLACPIFIDLLPRRFRKQRTWRQLTIAESLVICRPETAVAYRVQTGMAQWLFYRSLAPPANRTFFGQNLSTEFFAARFHQDGEVEELLEIEGFSE